MFLFDRVWETGNCTLKMDTFFKFGLLTIEHVGVTWPGQQSFFRELGPWLQPPIHVDTRSPTVIASPDPAIELSVLPCVLCRTGDRYRTPSSWATSLRHRQDVRFAVQHSKLMVHPSPPRSMLEHTAKDGPEDASLKHFRERLHPPLGWSRTRVH